MKIFSTISNWLKFREWKRLLMDSKSRAVFDMVHCRWGHNFSLSSRGSGVKLDEAWMYSSKTPRVGDIVLVAGAKYPCTPVFITNVEKTGHVRDMFYVEHLAMRNIFEVFGDEKAKKLIAEFADKNPAIADTIYRYNEKECGDD